MTPDLYLMLGLVLSPALFALAFGRGVTAVVPLLLISSVFLARPGILGEWTSGVGFGVAALAAVLVLLGSSSRESAGGVSRLVTGKRLFVWMAAVYAWLAIRTFFFDTEVTLGIFLDGAVLFLGTIGAAAVVLSRPNFAKKAGTHFVALVTVLSASYLVTAALWYASGGPTGLLFEIPRIIGGGAYQIYSPFSPMLGSREVFGVELPRFTGLGREPGIMGMYIGVAIFLAPHVGFRRWPWRAVLILALLGTWSTGGFGVFVAVAAYDWTLRSGRPFMSKVLAVPIIAAAAWLILLSPVVGITDKSEVDSVSVDVREQATREGIDALWSNPLRGNEDTAVEGLASVNLIASIGTVGLPYSLLVLCALWAPRRRHPAKALVNAPVLVVTLTLLTSQPPRESAWIFVCVLVCYATLEARHATPIAQDVAERSKRST